MSADHFHLCLFLDARGRPCNRRTMKPLSMCSEHREKPTANPRGTHTSPEYQRSRRARIAQAGVMEGA